MQVNVLQIPGTQFVCIAEDRSITQPCMQTGRLDWDQSILLVPEIAERIKPGNVVIDVGAYIGDTTVMFEQRGCVVFALEPREDAFICLTYNLPHVIAIRRPVGMRNQFVNFRDEMIPHNDPGNLGGRQVKQADQQSGQLKCISLDEINPHRCDFIKVDAEGFEPYVLNGAEQLIRRTKPVLHVEVNLPALKDHGFTDPRTVYDIISAWGYRIYERQPERIGSHIPWDLVCVPT